MTFEEFCKLCDQHDWAFEYTEDSSVYIQESKKHANLVFLAIDGGEKFIAEFNRRNESGRNAS